MTKIALRAVLAVTLACTALTGCAPIGLFFPTEVTEYKPEAPWGTKSATGGCPGHSPSLRVDLKDPDWLGVELGIWDTQQTGLRKLKEPTLFIVFPRAWHLSIEEQKRRAGTPIFVTASTPNLDITLADGTQKRIRVPEFADGFSTKRSPLYVSLEVPPQSMTIVIPDLTLNSERLSLGPVKFTYQKSTRYPC